MSKVSDDRAEELYQEIVESFGFDIDEDQATVVRRGIKSGRLDFDSEEQAFELQLVKPLELQNGSVIESITIEEPNVEQLTKSDSRSTDMAKTVNLIANVSRQPVTVIERLRMRDITLAGAVLSFFG